MTWEKNHDIQAKKHNTMNSRLHILIGEETDGINE